MVSVYSCSSNEMRVKDVCVYVFGLRCSFVSRFLSSFRVLMKFITRLPNWRNRWLVGVYAHLKHAGRDKLSW